MKKISLFILIIVSLLAFFSIKSSTINFDQKYQDLNIKADVSYRDNITVLRSLNVDNNQVTAGQTLWSIKVTADYMLSRNLTALFFYDHNFSKFAMELLVRSKRN